MYTHAPAPARLFLAGKSPFYSNFDIIFAILAGLPQQERFLWNNGRDLAIFCTPMTTRLILASASKRRERLLRQAGFSFDVAIPDVEEASIPGNIRKSVVENALEKNHWAVQRFPDRLILSADTAIEFRGKCVGKPATRKEAFDFMKMFSGKTHKVLTAVALSHTGRKRTNVKVCESTVTFKKLTDSTIRSYFRKCDPMDKAGAYDISRHGEMVVASYSGSFTNIVGLPMEIVEPMLRSSVRAGT